MNTRHYEMDRQERENFIKRFIGYGNIIATTTWDSHHPAGLETHTISDTGIITVYNKRTGKLVTKLIARPNQLKRYGLTLPASVYAIARQHQQLGYNEI